MNFENSQAFAHQMDIDDPLAGFRSKFHIPRFEGKDSIYYCGNSLGLQPKTVINHLERELKDWADLGVEGHFHGKKPWFEYHKQFQPLLADLVGAKPSEVVAMNTLTTNLHLLMVSFYRPTAKRFKIMVEGAAFPSDHYVVESQANFHGYKAEDAIIELMPREGEETLRTEDILAEIDKHGDELALILLGGVNYYTGQFFELEKIGKHARDKGITFGVDLAHAVGNVELKLNEWHVDFAAWCSYKYLNSGPGGVSGIFVHEKHGENPHLPRFAGWWGYEEETRFQMKKGFKPMKGAAGWQLSNAMILPMASLLASLEIFGEAGGVPALRKKSEKLTGFMEFLIEDLNKELGNPFDVITPKDPSHRGCQLSIIAKKDGKKLFDYLTENGVIADWREPDVIRIAPVPMYNGFEEAFHFVSLLRKAYLALK